jgi:uncharacterized membrane protein
MTQVLLLLLALLIGVVAGLRALTPPAVVAWGAALGWLPVEGTWAQWVGHPITVTVLTILLVVELVTDQLPSTPSRKTTPQFAARILTAAFAGAVVGAGFHHTFSSLGAGIMVPCLEHSVAMRRASGWSRQTVATTSPSRCLRTRSPCWAGLPS